MENVIDFSKKPERIVPYSFGDIITRENFIHFLVLSYALSRGSFVIQRVFFILMENKFGFDYETVIENFYNNGSFDCFTIKEQGIVEQAFRGVKKHLEEYEEIEILDEIKDEIDGLYDRPKSQGTIALNTALGFFDFDQIRSVPDFAKMASEFNTAYENSLN